MEKKDSIVQVNADKIAAFTGFKTEEIAIIKNTVAKGTTDTELAYFLSVCSSVQLNPMMKEIWCYKDNKGNMLVFTGRDGFLKRAQQSELWNGMTSAVVYKEDFFEMDVTNAKIIHKPDFKKRQNILGAYAIVKPKGCEFPTVEWADFTVYNKGWNVWKTDPASMIQKTAETHALKKAFGITVVQSEYDFKITKNIAEPIQLDAAKTELDIITKNLVEAFEFYQGADKEDLRQMCAEKKAANEFTLEFAQSIMDKIKGAV